MRDKGLSQREVEERSGGRISNSYIAKLLGGHARNPSGDKLIALADGLGVPLKEVLKTLGGEPTTDEGFRESALYYLYQQSLTADEETKNLIDMMIELLQDRIERTRGGNDNNNNNNNNNSQNTHLHPED